MCHFTHYYHPRMTCPHASQPWTEIVFCFAHQQQRSWALLGLDQKTLIDLAVDCPNRIIQEKDSWDTPFGVYDYHTCPMCVSLVQEALSYQCSKCHEEKKAKKEFDGVKRWFILWHEFPQVIRALGREVKVQDEGSETTGTELDAPVWCGAMSAWETGVYSDIAPGFARRPCKLKIPASRDQRFGRGDKTAREKFEDNEGDVWEDAADSFEQSDSPSAGMMSDGFEQFDSPPAMMMYNIYSGAGSASTAMSTPSPFFAKSEREEISLLSANALVEPVTQSQFSPETYGPEGYFDEHLHRTGIKNRRYTF